jgi:hypothetical protein
MSRISTGSSNLYTPDIKEQGRVLSSFAYTLAATRTNQASVIFGTNDTPTISLTPVYDTLSEVGSTTGLFTALNTGMYVFTLKVDLSSVGANDKDVHVQYKINGGTAVDVAVFNPYVVGDATLSTYTGVFSVLVKLTKGQTFAFWMHNVTGSAAAIIGVTSTFSGSIVCHHEGFY